MRSYRSGKIEHNGQKLLYFQRLETAPNARRVWIVPLRTAQSIHGFLCVRRFGVAAKIPAHVPPQSSSQEDSRLERDGTYRRDVAHRNAGTETATAPRSAGG